jgi:hypothetical protein
MVGRLFTIPFATAGDRVPIPNPTQPSGAVSFTDGFTPDYELANTDPNYKPVPRDETNALYHDMTEAIGIIQKQGYSDWFDPAVSLFNYPINAYVRHLDIVWRSTVPNNSATPGAGPEWYNESVPVVQTLPFGYISGFTLANNSGAPNTTVDVGPGTARSSDNTVDITLTSTIRGILQSSGSWAAGDNQNKLDTGAKANSTTYHEFVIGHPTLADDILYSLSATAPTLPVGYAGFRRTGRIATDGSGNIRPFKDRGDGCFDWVTPSIEATLATTAPGTSLLTLSGMAGGLATARLQAACLGDSIAIKVIPTDVTDLATSTGPTTWTGGVIAQAGGASGNESASGESSVRVDTSGQVRVRTYTAAGNLDYRIIVFGWKEYR